MEWRKAKRSGAANGCVEIAFGSDGRAVGMVRDSKSPERGYLTITPDVFAAFLTSVRDGDYELPVRVDGRLCRSVNVPVLLVG
jgi:hypothetical protein